MSDFILNIYALDDDDASRILIDQASKFFPACTINIFEEKEEFLLNFNINVHMAIIDHRLNGGVTGFEIMHTIKDLHRPCKVMIITGNRDPQLIIDYYNKGAYRVQLKDNRTFKEELIANVRDAYDEIKTARNFFLTHMEMFKKGA